MGLGALFRGFADLAEDQKRRIQREKLMKNFQSEWDSAVALNDKKRIAKAIEQAFLDLGVQDHKDMIYRSLRGNTIGVIRKRIDLAFNVSSDRWSGDVIEKRLQRLLGN